MAGNREYYTNYNKYIFEDISIGTRNSVKEYNQDVDVRHNLWKTGVSDYVVDIGAGFGSYTLMALANSAGFVFAFEKDKEIANVLRRNLQNNHTLNFAERASVCTWNLDDSHRTVDKYLNELSYKAHRIDWIKIDAGTVPDNRVLLWSCKDTIKNFRPSILINDYEPPKLSFLEGYKVTSKIEGHSLLTVS